MLGPEKVVNSTFSNGSTGWNVNNPPWTSVVTGSATADGSATSDMNQATNLPTVGETYQLTITISAVTASGGARMQYGGLITPFYTTVGTHTFRGVATSNDRFKVRPQAGGTVTVTLASAKEVFMSPFGDNIVLDSDFTGAPGWIITNDAEISNGTLKIRDTPGTSPGNARQNGILKTNTYYKIDYEILANNGGGIRIESWKTTYVLPSSVGVHSVVYKTHSTNNDLSIGRSSGNNTDVEIGYFRLSEWGRVAD